MGPQTTFDIAQSEFCSAVLIAAMIGVVYPRVGWVAFWVVLLGLAWGR